ncbi:MAG: hypothetical protein M1125_03740 [Candidatus Marsarchaeota archaeon]|nr:hypothetical protein [Candidatus Marsarchaeota archaeon]
MSDYDYVLRKFLPEIKSRAADVLFHKYNMTQTKIASMLGISQAEVSKYISNPKNFISNEGKVSDKDINDFVRSIMLNDSYKAQKVVCRLCPRGEANECSIMIR